MKSWIFITMLSMMRGNPRCNLAKSNLPARLKQLQCLNRHGPEGAATGPVESSTAATPAAAETYAQALFLASSNWSSSVEPDSAPIED